MNNKLIIAGIAGLATVGVMGIYQEASAYGVGEVDFQVNTASLNVRSGPSTSYPVIGSVKKGQVYKPFDSTQNGAWGKIKLSNGKTGWVSMQYMKNIDTCTIPNEPSNSQSSEKNWAGIVTASVLNVRSNPTTSSSVRYKLTKGTEVEVKYEIKGWYRIEYKKNGRFDYGYVSKSYITKKTISSSSNNNIDNSSSSNSNNSSQVQQPSYDYKIEGEVYDEETGALRWFERTVYAPATTPLNIRQNPTTKSAVVGKAPRYSKIFISGSYGDWYRVRGVDNNGNSYDGWAHSDYIF